jgi:3-dehydroquinate synthase
VEGPARATLNGPYVWGAPLGLTEEPPQRLGATFSVEYSFVVRFTSGAFDPDNGLLADVVDVPVGPAKLLAILDADVVARRPELPDQVRRYAERHASRLTLVAAPIVIGGGERLKDEPKTVEMLLRALYDHRIDRHSYMLALGGGALLDVAGYAAAVAHRGVRLVRMPTTVLAQADSGVGVKNGVNAFETKNFVGTFAPPVAVINDESLLSTLSDRDWRAGLSEVAKVALLGDADLFDELERLAPALIDRDAEAMSAMVRRSAQIHLSHIVNSGDAFERTSARPLDFGHWSAHKLEKLSHHRLRHGEAVAIGLALDCTYAELAGILGHDDRERVIALLRALELPLSAPELEDPRLLDGLREFREHLGGELTIALIDGIGSGIVVHEMDPGLIRRAVGVLEHEIAEAA